MAVDFREIYARLKNRCVDRNSGTFISLDQAVGRLKAGTLKFEHVGRYPFDLEKLYCNLKTYCSHLKVSNFLERRKGGYKWHLRCGDENRAMFSKH